ncbi:hypothetical protein OAG47_01700 [Verrucomicrobiales bacterium]|nr:hypothetical protein [Verrucomicrobiales bacterium]
MEKKYRLEFNEAQQSFHLDNYTHTEGKHGWFTIFEYCTDLEFKVYESFVNRKLEKKKLTKEYLLKCAGEVKRFWDNLEEYKVEINEKKEILCSQIWKSKYSDISYKVLQMSEDIVEMCDLENIWDCKEISREELNKHFILQDKFKDKTNGRNKAY